MDHPQGARTLFRLSAWWGSQVALIVQPAETPNKGSGSCTGCRFLLGYPGSISHCHMWQRPITVAQASVHACTLWSPR